MAFSCFQLLYMTPAVNKMDGSDFITQHVVNTCQRRLRCHGTSKRRTTQKKYCIASVIKVSGQINVYQHVKRMLAPALQ